MSRKSSLIRPTYFSVCWQIDSRQTIREIERQLRRQKKGYISQLTEDQTLLSCQLSVRCENGSVCNIGFDKEVKDLGLFIQLCKAKSPSPILDAVIEYSVYSTEKSKSVVVRQPQSHPFQSLPIRARSKK